MPHSLTLTLDETENQSASGESTVDMSPDYPISDSQLEDLQGLLEISHQNEERAKEEFNKLSKALEESNNALHASWRNQKEEKLDNAALRLALTETQKQLTSLREMYKKKFDEHTQESLRLKQIITKQTHLLQSKDHEVAQLLLRITAKDHELNQLSKRLSLLENNRYYVANNRQTFFNELNAYPEPTQPDLFMLGRNNNRIL